MKGELLRASPFFFMLRPFLLFLLFSSQVFAESSYQCPKVFQHSASPFEGRVKSRGGFVYSAATGRPGRIIHYSLSEYRAAVASESVPPDAILVMERIDTSLDLPFVVGLLLGKPLTVEGTHIELQAQKLGVPFAVLPGIYLDAKVRSISRQEGRRRLQVTSEGNIRFLEVQDGQAEDVMSSVLPRLTPFVSAGYVYSFDTGETHRRFPLEWVGGKARPLLDLRASGVDDVPRMAWISPNFYLDFITGFGVRGVGLSQWIERLLTDVDILTTEQLKQRLAFLRHAFLVAKPLDGHPGQIFHWAYQRLRSVLRFNQKDQLSIRSNNEFEDYIAQGMFDSLVTGDVSESSIELAIRKVFSSLYSFRAFQIRQSRGLIESNVRMPLLIHRYLAVEVASGTATVRLNQRAQLEARLQLVRGPEETATNPSLDARAETLLFENDGTGWRLSEGELTLDEVGTLVGHLQKLKVHFERDLLHMSYQATQVETEFILQKGQVELLQYKRRYEPELIGDLLAGRIVYEDFEKVRSMSAGSIYSDLDVEPYGVRLLESVRRLKYARYGILRDPEGKLYQIFWLDSRIHTHLRARCLRLYPMMEWVEEGYLRWDSESGRIWQDRRWTDPQLET